MVGDKVHLPEVLFQPMAADDVASGKEVTLTLARPFMKGPMMFM